MGSTYNETIMLRDHFGQKGHIKGQINNQNSKAAEKADLLVVAQKYSV